MDKQKILISYTGGKVISVTDTFNGALEMMLTNETLKKYYALKITFPDTGLVLYVDDHKFLQYYQGDITYDELVEHTWCDELYRNWLEIETMGDVVEPGALWLLRGQELTLIDEDRYITFSFSKEGFEVVQ